jgi:hypothetical protein
VFCITVSKSINGTTETRELYFTVNGIRPGANGTNAVIYNIVPEKDSINVARNGSAYVPANVSITCGYVKNDGGSGNITVSEPGLYKITLNTAELAKVADGENTTALKIEKYDGSAPVFSGMAISGSFNDWGDTDMTPCSANWENHDWYIIHDFAAADEVKIKQAGSWDFNKGGEFITYGEGMYVYGVGNGANLVMPEAGKYMIIFNDITGYIRFIKQ